jgi:ubiquinone/menaquinone biosynthesis C-methylase UbiE
MKRPNCSQLDEEIQELIGRYCQGNGIDVGCGYTKIGACVGIDKIPWGSRISERDKTKKISQADWSFDVRELPLKDRTMDFVYASHIIEHITLNKFSAETNKAVLEWLRVLKTGGFLVIIVPNINYCIPPVAKRAGLKVYHGLDPKEFKLQIEGISHIKVMSFQSLSTKDVFDCVLRKDY